MTDGDKGRAAFYLGSMAATFAQGVVLGAFIRGIEVVDRAYAGSALAWLSRLSDLMKSVTRANRSS